MSKSVFKQVDNLLATKVAKQNQKNNYLAASTITFIHLNIFCMKAFRIAMMLMLVTAFTANVSAQKKVDPTGTWTYEATMAPYEYSSGDIVVDKDGKDFTVQIVLGEYYKVKGEKVVYEKNELSFVVYIEGEAIDIKMTIDKEAAKGTASYSDGDIPITAKKKK